MTSLVLLALLPLLVLLLNILGRLRRLEQRLPGGEPPPAQLPPAPYQPRLVPAWGLTLPDPGPAPVGESAPASAPPAGPGSGGEPEAAQPLSPVEAPPPDRGQTPTAAAGADRAAAPGDAGAPLAPATDASDGAITATPLALPAALSLPATPLFSLEASSWRRLERTLIENWTGILGVVVLVCGITFLAVNLALRLGALVRFLLTLTAGGGLMLPSLLWGSIPRWRPLCLWLRSGGAAVMLFACMAAGALPELGLRWLEDPGLAWALLLAGMALNLALAWFTRHQSIASLHVLINLVPLLFSPQVGLTLAIASADVVCGQALPRRRPWDRHRLLLALGYSLFQLRWSLGASATIASLPGLRAWALLAALLVFGSGVALIQFGPGRQRLPSLRLAALLASWGGLALALLIDSPQAWLRATALLLAALLAALLARNAQRQGLRSLQMAQALVAQGLLFTAVFSLGPLLLDNLLITAALLLESGLFLLFGLRSRQALIRRSGWWLVVLLSVALALQGLLRLDFTLITPTATSLRDTGLLLAAAALLVALASQYKQLSLAAPWPPLLGWLAAAEVVVGASLLPPPLWQPGFALVAGGGLLLAERRLRPAGLATGSLVMVAVAHLLAWLALLQAERPIGQQLALLLPLLALAAVFCVTATAERQRRRCLGLDLIGLDLALAASVLLQPISPLLPGVAWLLLSVLALELAQRWRRPEANHALVLAAGLVAGFASHFLLVTHFSLDLVALPGGLVLRARLLIALVALAVTLYWGRFQASPGLRENPLWQQLQPCFLEFSLLVVASIALQEVDGLWRPLFGSVLALLLLTPWVRRRTAARIQIYAVLAYWLSVAATLANLGTTATPSPHWFEQPGPLSTLAILLQVLFLVFSRRWLRAEDLADPGGWPLLRWIGAGIGRRGHRWLGYPMFLAVALHLAGHYNRALLTLLWSLEAFVIFALSVVHRDNQFRCVALLALGLCLLRLLVIDLAATDLLLRGLVFVGVGLLMLAMNVISNRFRERIR